ncbi:hypothetical protein ONS95_002714 [Cadophora gregata]|uniref:uncharacterized protein n=1 Tax=Cadophora gregata TaxID=51156 RepID=UPI0026DD6288|nr:uncharacterized protein ONS95_002714 [Cadophora gregata]KAK0110054.1 hypothetical protein ONS95_002714 [Cadophora gregata]KAK0110325.1 hypothetical protein ONS96_001941 [Cadophora gregata f. sp. sojae]
MDRPVDQGTTDALPTVEPPSPSIGSTTKSKGSNWRSAIQYFNREIAIEYADIPIIACCLVSGLCDSSAYNAWSCFVSMQTGNTIFLALGASDQPKSKPFGWLKSLVSITSFLLGCFIFASTRLINPKARGTLATSFVVQSLFIILAAILVQAGVVPQPDGIVTESGSKVNLLELLPLGFLAFQSGGQIVTSRILGFNEVPTTVLTSVYCDIASDSHILARDNVKRNRRIGAVIFILIGGIAGGWISRSSAGMSTSLWIAAGIKLVIAFSWSLWKSKNANQM